MGVLDIIKPIVRFLPEIDQSRKNLPFQEKLNWTLMTLGLFLVFSQIPLFGIQNRNSADPLYWVRVILASNRGTLMELGISPIVTASMILQLLVGAKILKIDQSNEEDRQLYSSAQKLFGVLLTLAQAFVYVVSGMYGNVGFFGGIFIIAQLLVAGMLVILFDEIMSKGYGLGSGTSLFIATNTCESIVWSAFSPMTVNYGSGNEFEGAVINLFYSLLTRNPISALWHSFFRASLPNLFNLAATAAMVVVVVYLQGIRVDIPTAQNNIRIPSEPFQIKLFYTSSMSIMLFTSLVSNVFFVSQMLYSRFAGNILISILGSWSNNGGRSSPIGGIAYYLSPPESLLALLYDPVHAVISTLIIITACALFSKTWVSVAGTSSADVYRQLSEQKRKIRGFSSRQDAINYLDHYIPIAALLCGVTIGVLSVAGDILGAVGSGQGILLAVTTVLQYYDVIAKDSESRFID